MKSFALLAACAATSAHASLVAWFPLEVNSNEALLGTKGTLVGDASFGVRDGLKLGGKNGALFFKDSSQFSLPGSFSLSAKVYPAAWPQGGTSPRGQIVFRGDDRSALDNYSLNVGEDGYFTFYVDGSDGGRALVRAQARLRTWQTLLATFDAGTHTARLYVDGFLAAQSSDPVSPFVVLDSQWSPGFSIGNVQNPLGGCHNQPFHGSIRDVRLWNGPATWDDVTAVPVLRRSARR
ncbi:MAG: LamG domain-containing protein [Armatimonadetes bacterium]|nr:LamG domain-containing protein [Armatimonadota bacterium]